MNIKFKFSLPYEKALMLIKPKLEVVDSFRDAKKHLIKSRIRALERFWATGAVEIALNKITSLKFKENVVCYLNSARNMSDPLSIKIEDLKDMQDNLIHELIHVLLTQNNIGKKKGWKKIQDKYKNENQVTRRHILIHAIHELVTKEIRPSRLERIQKYSKNPYYINSWKIVKKEGAENLIKNLS